VKVLLVDFGGHYECKTTELLSAAFTDFPSQAFHCHLEGAGERPPATVAALLRQYESKIPLLLVVRHKTMSDYFVDLVDTSWFCLLFTVPLQYQNCYDVKVLLVCAVVYLRIEL
jgi:hypothetical protein